MLTVMIHLQHQRVWHISSLSTSRLYRAPHVGLLAAICGANDCIALHGMPPHSHQHAQSVINRELHERQKLLTEVLLPAPKAGIPVSGAMTGRMVALLPGVKLMSGVPGSKLSNRLEDIQEKFEESIRVGVRFQCLIAVPTGVPRNLTSLFRQV